MRQLGILLAISSLPGKCGTGDFSKKAFQLVEMLKKSHVKYWQILPLNPIGYGHSPYQPFSSYAIDELYIDLDDLKSRGLINEFETVPAGNKTQYEYARAIKEKAILEAYKNFSKSASNRKMLEDYLKNNPDIDQFCEFISLKEQNNNVTWTAWTNFNVDIERKNRHALAQMILFEEWNKIKMYAKKRNIKIIGDVPFYVGFDSSDVYYHRENFLLDEKFNPTVVAGVPPDYFSADGQKWGNPIYNWEVIGKNGFDFIARRVEAAGKMYDVVRLDHFRAFDSYWAINPMCPTAVEGEWRYPDGYGFFYKLFERNPKLEIIAEDLGDLRPEVLTLKNHFNLPGMRILEFSIFDEKVQNKVFDTNNTIYYTGTHDNDTLLGWLETVDYLPGTLDEKFEYCLNYAINRPEQLVVLPAQDVMKLDNNSRMNVPGIIDDFNWTFKLKDFRKFALSMKKIKKAIYNYGKN